MLLPGVTLLLSILLNFQSFGFLVEAPIYDFDGSFEIKNEIYRSYGYERLIEIKIHPKNAKYQGEENKILYKELIPHADSIRGLVFINPSMAGETRMEQQIFIELSKKGIASVIGYFDELSSFESTVNDLQIHDRGLERAVIGVNSYIKFFTKFRSHKIVPVGTTGASLGGIIASFTAGKVSSVHGAYIVAAGGGLANILTYSEQRDLVKLRKARMKSYGLDTLEEYFNLMDTHIENEPLHAVASQKKVRFVALSRDKTIPFQNQVSLAKAWGATSSLEVFSTGHYRGIIENFYFRQKKIITFFDELFAQ